MLLRSINGNLIIAIAKKAKGIYRVGYLIIVSDTCIHWQDKKSLRVKKQQPKILLAK